MFRTRSSLVLSAAVASCWLVAPVALADDPTDPHREHNQQMQDRDPHDPIDTQGQRGNPPGVRPTVPEQMGERLRSIEAERVPDAFGLGGGYVEKFDWVMARTLPLSPLLYPINNDVSVAEWIESCVVTRSGWDESAECYGGGWGGEREEPRATRMPSAS